MGIITIETKGYLQEEKNRPPKKLHGQKEVHAYETKERVAFHVNADFESLLITYSEISVEYNGKTGVATLEATQDTFTMVRTITYSEKG